MGDGRFLRSKTRISDDDVGMERRSRRVRRSDYINAAFFPPLSSSKTKVSNQIIKDNASVVNKYQEHQASSPSLPPSLS